MDNIVFWWEKILYKQNNGSSSVAAPPHVQNWWFLSGLVNSNVAVQKTAEKILVSVFWNAHGIILIDYFEKERLLQ